MLTLNSVNCVVTPHDDVILLESMQHRHKHFWASCPLTAAPYFAQLQLKNRFRDLLIGVLREEQIKL